MLTPDQFISASELPAFKIDVAEFNVNGACLGPTTLHIHYNEQFSPRIQLQELATFKDAFNQPTISFKYKTGDTDQTLFITKANFSSNKPETDIEAVSTREPILLVDKQTSSSFDAVLLNPPEFLQKPIILTDIDGVEYTIVRAKETNSPCVISSNLELRADAPLKPLGPLIDFLTFVKGGHLGFGNLIAHDENAVIALRLIGFTRNDAQKRKTNWFDIGIQSQLPAIFTLFTKALSDDLAQTALRQTIEFYRASNASRDVSIEMSIIAAHSALEAIVNFILEYRAGWSNALMTSRTNSFSDKLRAACYYYGIQADLLSESPELRKVVSARNIDSYALISFFRNKLVHQDIKFTPTGIQLHEIWLLAQWLVEVLIFGVIGYRGKMIDRRLYQGWRGQTCQIPLKNI
ncbi:hypothetical protein [Pacificibacter sp. AS14]|uniref:hypothetical protein n=1 Tax=Pacificibacter sp. AS14 TaxID=3135785 RepID=UPI00317DDF9F